MHRAAYQALDEHPRNSVTHGKPDVSVWAVTLFYPVLNPTITPMNRHQLLIAFLTVMLTTALFAEETSKETTVSLIGKWSATGVLPDGGTSESTFTVTKDEDSFRVDVVTSDGDERTESERNRPECGFVTDRIEVEQGVGENGLAGTHAQRSQTCAESSIGQGRDGIAYPKCLIENLRAFEKQRCEYDSHRNANPK